MEEVKQIRDTSAGDFGAEIGMMIYQDLKGESIQVRENRKYRWLDEVMECQDPCGWKILKLRTCDKMWG